MLRNLQIEEDAKILAAINTNNINNNLGHLNGRPSVHRKAATSLGGRIFYISQGRVDLWRSQYSDPFLELNRYDDTHDHCRCAFNVSYRSLVMSAQKKEIAADDEFQRVERIATLYAEKLNERS